MNANLDRTRGLLRASPVRTGLARLLGAHAEDRVEAGWLGRLPDGWHLVNDVPVGDAATLDYVIVGPAGVFAVNTRNVTGQVWIGRSGVRVNGHATDDVWTLLDGARHASRLLSEGLERPVAVRAVLAILADGWTIHETPSDVFIGPPRVVRDELLRRLPPVLTPLEVTAIATAASRPSTWDDFPLSS